MSLTFKYNDSLGAPAAEVEADGSEDVYRLAVQLMAGQGKVAEIGEAILLSLKASIGEKAFDTLTAKERKP
jgi:hypothetical protein